MRILEISRNLKYIRGPGGDKKRYKILATFPLRQKLPAFLHFPINYACTPLPSKNSPLRLQSLKSPLILYSISLKTSPLILHFPQNFLSYTPFPSKLPSLYYTFPSKLIPANTPFESIPSKLSRLYTSSPSKLPRLYSISLKTSLLVLHFSQNFPAYTQFPSKFPHLYSIFLNISPLILHFPTSDRIRLLFYVKIQESI